MKKKEFLDLIDAIGLDLIDLDIVVDEYCLASYTAGVHEVEDEWICYEVDERNHYYEEYRGDEDGAFEVMYNNVVYRLGFEPYSSDAISREVIFTSKDVLVNYLCDAYDMSSKEAEDAWEYLRQDFRVLNEFKYYVLNNDFVPEDVCYKVQGYSAKQIYESTYLEVIGAYNYLIYLRRKPKEALEMLKKGLPRK